MKEIQTNGITILLVEVPEDAREFKIENGLLLFKADFIPFGIVILPSGQCQILGKSTELSEEQMKEILPIYEGAIRGYRIYTQRPDLLTKDIQESYLSLLEANGIVDRNNLANPDTTTILGSSPSGIYYEVLDELRDKWQESQSKVKHYLVYSRR